MKLKQLSAAVAVASYLVPGIVFAQGHPVTTSIPNLKLGLEAYGQYENEELEEESQTINSGEVTFTDSVDESSSDFGNERLRLSLEADVAEDTIIRVELEWNPDSSSRTVTTDLFLQKDYGSTTVTAGRFKQLMNAEDYVEISDRVFFDSSSSLMSGPMRRVDGFAAHWNDGGFHAAATLFEGGLEVEETDIFIPAVDPDDIPASIEDLDIESQFGYSLRGGWLGQIDNVQIGISASHFDEDRGDSSNTDVDSFGTTRSDFDTEASGHVIEGIFKAGALVAGLNYSDTEVEFSSHFADFDTNGVLIDSFSNTSDTDSDGWAVWGVWNIENADRSISPFGVLQGPQLSAGQKGYELGIRLTSSESDSHLTNIPFLGADPAVSEGEEEIDTFTISLNAYCGEFTKWYVEYSTSDGDDSSRFGTDLDFGSDGDSDDDVLRIGGRIRF